MSSVERPVLLATKVDGPIGVPAGASLPLVEAGKTFHLLQLLAAKDAKDETPNESM